MADYFFAVSPKAGIDRFGNNVKITFFIIGLTRRSIYFFLKFEKLYVRVEVLTLKVR